MRIRLTFFMDVPEDFSARGYGSVIAFARTVLHRAGLRTSVWRCDFEPEKPQKAINSNGPTGAPS